MNFPTPFSDNDFSQESPTPVSQPTRPLSIIFSSISNPSQHLITDQIQLQSAFTALGLPPQTLSQETTRALWSLGYSLAAESTNGAPVSQSPQGIDNYAFQALWSLLTTIRKIFHNLDTDHDMVISLQAQELGSHQFVQYLNSTTPEGTLYPKHLAIDKKKRYYTSPTGATGATLDMFVCTCINLYRTSKLLLKMDPFNTGTIQASYENFLYAISEVL